MSEKPEGQLDDPISVTPMEEHSREKEVSFLARVLGFVIGRKQAGAAEPDVKELAGRIKELGPDAVNQTINAAIDAYAQKRREEEAGEAPVKPE